MYPNKVLLDMLLSPPSPPAASAAAPAPAAATPSLEWSLREVRKFTDDRYHANHWLMRLASNGALVLAPTTEGTLLAWRTDTGPAAASGAERAQKSPGP